MNGFLARLAARQIAPSGTLRPRAVSRFAAPDTDVVADATTPLVVPDMRAAAATHAASAAPPLAASAIRPPAASAASAHAASPVQPTRGHADSSAPAAPDHEAGARRVLPHAQAQPPALAAERRADERVVPRSPRVQISDPVVPLGTPPVERAPFAAPLVPREIVRARAAQEPHMPVAARAAAATAPHVAAPADEPVVRITIGRIDVRAAAPPPPREKPAAPRPKTLSLDEYLDRRHGARR